MSNPTSPLKPTPLFGRSDSNGRVSPFRRPESPLGRSPSNARISTPQGSPLKQSTHSAGPSPTSLPQPRALFGQTTSGASEDRAWLSRAPAPESPTRSPTVPYTNANNLGNMASRFESQASPSANARPTYTRTATATSSATVRPTPVRTPTTNRNADPVSSIPPQHLHTMRESFAVLDRNNVGSVTPADLTHQLNELGLDTSASSLSQYFSSSTPQPLNLSSYLHLLSSDLSRLTSSAELLEAFSAFDTDDSGQIDVQELRDALISTLPEPGDDARRLNEGEVDMVMDGFVGRRAFRRGAAGNTAGLSAGERRPVFRYGDFVKGIWGVAPEEGKVEAV